MPAGEQLPIRKFSWRETLADVLDSAIADRDPLMEEMLLGSLILEPNRIDQVSARLRSQDFFDSDLGQVFDALCLMRELKENIQDPRVLISRLKKYGLIGKEEYGLKASHIAKWTGRAQPSSAVYYAEEIIRAYQIRTQLREVIKSIDDLSDPTNDPKDSASRLVTKIESIFARTSVEVISIGAAAEEAVAAVKLAKREERMTGIPTSLGSLDRILGGLFGGELTILAARPAVGKTALAMQICHAAAASGYRVLFVSLEMKASELAMRVCCAMTGVNNKHIRQVSVSTEEIGQLEAAASELHEINLDIYATPKATLSHIRAAIKGASYTDPVNLVCVDYLQLVTPEDKKKLRSEQVAEISKGLKEMAQEFNVPMLVLCQLNREAEGEVPTMAHLRESGSIEQDADTVIAIHRGPTEEGRSIAQLIILKNRHGDHGTIDVNWRPEATRFEEPDEPEQKTFI